MSSDDPTKKLPDEDKPMDTKPTLETILDRINAVDEKWDKRFDQLELRLNRADSRMDRMESLILEVRADLRDLRDEVKQALPQLK